MKSINFSLLASCLLLMLAVLLKSFEPPFIIDLENKTFDTYQRISPRPYESAPVRIIDIDDASLARLGQWPWPRNMVAELVEKLHAAGAVAIAFDIVFAEPDRTSPQQMFTLWGKQDLLQKLGDFPDYDVVMAKAIADAPVVTGFVMTNDKASIPVTKGNFSFTGEHPQTLVLPFPGAVTALPILQAAAHGNGALNNQPDRDGISRHIPLVLSIENHLFPSLALEALRVAQGAKGYIIKTVETPGKGGMDTAITSIKVGSVVIPTDRHGEQWIYYSPHISERYLPAWQVLDGTVDKHKIDGHIVLIGTSAAGLKDIRATPTSPAMPGVEVFAQSLEQALLGTTLSRPDWVKGAEIALMVIIGIVLLTVNHFLSPLWGLCFMSLMLAITVAISWMTFSLHQVLVEPVMPILTVVLLYVCDSLARYLRAERERLHIRHAFAQYMSPELVRQLASHPEKLALGGENRVISILFCDMRDFTTISENMPPMALTQLISRFLTPMTEQVLAYNGTVDKYIGDNVMAFWNAPLPDAKHAINAAKAALGMRQAVNTLNATQSFSFPIGVSISVNTGECCVGNMGTPQRFNYSALGDGVNLAARLEGQCKYYGVDIIVSDETAKALTDFPLLELDLIRVKGKANAVRIYTLLGDESVAVSDAYQLLRQGHEAMLSAYRSRDWEDAHKALEECMRRTGIFLPLTQGTYTLFAERIADFRKNPPLDEWDGVYDTQRSVRLAAD